MPTSSEMNWLYSLVSFLCGVGISNIEYQSLKEKKVAPWLLLLVFSSVLTCATANSAFNMKFISMDSAIYNYGYMAYCILDSVALFCLTLAYISRLRIFMEENSFWRRTIYCWMTLPFCFISVNILNVVVLLNPNTLNIERVEFVYAISLIPIALFNITSHVIIVSWIIAKLNQIGLWHQLSLFRKYQIYLPIFTSILFLASLTCVLVNFTFVFSWLAFTLDACAFILINHNISVHIVPILRNDSITVIERMERARWFSLDHSVSKCF